MRKLYPIDKESIPTIKKLDSFKLTEDQYNSILESLTELKAADSSISGDLDDLKQSLRNEIVSVLASFDDLSVADKATIAAVVADSLTALSSQIDVLSSNDITSTVISAVNGNISHLRTEDITAGTIAADSVTAPTITAETITAENANIENYSIDSGSIDSLSSNQASIASADIDSLNASAATISSSVTDEATITEAAITKATIDDLYSDKIYAHYVNHNQLYNRQVITDDSISADGHCWIILPKFKNGVYWLIARNGENGPYLWSMEVTNSTRNVAFNWSSRDDYNYLQDVEIIEDASDQVEFIQIHIKTNQLATYIYSYCNDYDCQTPPSYYNSKQIDGTKEFEIKRSRGNYLPNAVFVGELSAESLVIDSIEFEQVTIKKKINLPSGYDAYGEPVGYTSGLPGQIIMNTSDNELDKVQWIAPASEAVRDDIRPMTSDGVSHYDGSVDVTPEGADEPEYDYPIVNLGNNTEVHGTLKVDGSTKLKNFYNGPEDEFVPDSYGDNSIVIFTEVIEDSDYIENRVYRYRKDESLNPVLEEVIASTDKQDQKPVIYDQATNSYKTVDGLAIDELNVTELHADKAYIKELDTVKEETISSTGDYTVLRANNPAALGPDEHSGLLIHNYDSNGTDSAIVSDSTGTIRVGTGIPTDTTYPTLYFDKTTQKYYTDIEDPTTEVDPEGALTSWSLKDDTEDYVKFENAVFSVINFDSLQPVLTRDEAANLKDQGLLKWNSNEVKADTIPLPTKNEQSLISVIEENTTDVTVYDFEGNLLNNDCTAYDGTGTPHDSEVLDGLYGYEDGLLYKKVDDVWHKVMSIAPEVLDEDPSEEPSATGDLNKVLYAIPDGTTSVKYSWKDKQAGVYHFATEAEYLLAEAEIPVDSLIIIDEESNYNYGDDINE